MTLTDRDIDRIADAVVRKFIEHGKRRSQARFISGLSIDEMKRRGREELMGDKQKGGKR